jgi:hypothetical protein
MVMPRLVSPFPTRLAVVPPPETIDSSFESWLDVALNFLQNRHPEIVIIERDALPPITEEVVMQHSGRVHGETAAHIGKLVGADTLLSYEVITLQSDAFQRVAKTGGEVTGSVEIRLLNVETGLTLFRQLATAMAQLPTPEEDQSWPDEVIHLAHGEAVTHAMSYALAALVAAFGDNPLGLVVNLTAPGKGVLIRGVLQGGPAHQAGFQQGDRILQINDYPISDWTVPVSLPARALVERAGEEQEFRLGNGL